MIRLQEDLLNVYNLLTEFSKGTLLGPYPVPIKVEYSESLNSLCFEQRGLKISVNVLNYYCQNLRDLKKTFLLPEDYIYLMDELSRVINTGALLHDRVCLGPEKYGFSLYDMVPGIQNLKLGPVLIGKFKFVSGNSWLFRKLTNRKYERI